MKINKICEGIFRLLVPFEEEISTTVYFVVSDHGAAIIDAATFASDADDYIIPSLDEIGIPREEVRYLLLTHNHFDHVGAAERLLERLPNITGGAPFPMDTPRFSLLSDGDIVLGRLKTVALPGHTADSVAFFDIPTKSLLSSDCLQLNGIGKYRNGIGFPSSYRNSIEILKNMDIERIVAAHEFDPLGSIAEGRLQVQRYLDTCLKSGVLRDTM